MFKLKQWLRSRLKKWLFPEVNTTKSKSPDNLVAWLIDDHNNVLTSVVRARVVFCSFNLLLIKAEFIVDKQMNASGLRVGIIYKGEKSTRDTMFKSGTKYLLSGDKLVATAEYEFIWKSKL